MEPLDLVNLVARWMHILAAITAVGGTIFARLVVVPSLDLLPADQRGALHAAMRLRWSRIVAAAIGFLLLSGLYNIGVTLVEYQVPRWYYVVFGVKFMLAFVIFAVASLLSGQSPAADNLRRHLRFWLNLNIALAVLVVCLSGVLRTAEKVPKKDPAMTDRAAAGAANSACKHSTVLLMVKRCASRDDSSSKRLEARSWFTIAWIENHGDHRARGGTWCRAIYVSSVPSVANPRRDRLAAANGCGVSNTI